MFAACLFALLVFLTPQLSLADDTGETQFAQNVAGAEQAASALPDVSESDQDTAAAEAGPDAVVETASESSISDDVSTSEAAKAAAPILSYTAYVQNKGWMGYVDAGKTAGTTGKSFNMEALKVRLCTNGKLLDTNAISVEVHVAGIGWVNAVDNDALAGTTGKSKAIEAVKIRLSDELSSGYSIWYRIHSANFCWLDWTCDDGEAGSTGYGLAFRRSRF